MTDETTFIRPGYRLCSGRPTNIDGILLRPYSVGILISARITDDGQIWVQRNSRRDTYHARVIGHGTILGVSGKPKLFRTEDAAAKAAIKVWRKMQEAKA